MQKKIKQKIKLNINGVKQCVNVIGSNSEDPLVLFIHGGPGISCDPVFRHYNHALESSFIVATWHQRGAGKSYCNLNKGKASLETYVSDATAVIKYLLQTYNKRKVAIIAHSWGTIIGMELCKKYPDYISHYFPVSQIVDMQASLRWSVTNFNPNSRTIKRVKALDYDNLAPDSYKVFSKVNRYIVRHKGSLSNRRTYSKFGVCYLRPKHFSFIEGIITEFCYQQTAKAVWEDIITTNYRNLDKLAVPITFICGSKDLLTSGELTYQFYENLQADKQFVWFENSAHCPLWEEPAKFNQLVYNSLYKKES